MARRGRDVAKERLWRDAVRRQRQSGLSVREFCSRAGLSEAGFHWWRRELARRSATSSVRNKKNRSATSAIRPSRDAAARFLPVAVAPISAEPAYEVALPGGVRVLVYASAAEKLAEVLAALERPAC
ncbi:MAG: hypothetical protein AB7U73_19940 [Pirellulales bacterium]